VVINTSCVKNLCISGKGNIFSERVVNLWNSLSSDVDFGTLISFKRSIETVEFAKYLRCFLKVSVYITGLLM